MIEFFDPPIGTNVTTEDMELFSSLPKLFHAASSSVGFVIKLHMMLEQQGFEEICCRHVPVVQSALEGNSHPRVVIGYATLLWFTHQVYNVQDVIHE